MIPIPDLDLQKKIVLKHKSLIERVTLLEDYNSILYDLLDLLYKSEKKKWVDTETIDLKSIAKLKNGYSYSSDELGASNIGMATIKNFKKGGGFRTLGYKEIIPDKELNNDLFLKKFDIIIAHTDLTPSAEILGNVELILDTNDYDKIIPSMDLVKVWSVDDEYSNELLYTLIKCSGFKDLALQSKNGTTVLHLEKDALKNYKLLVPKDKTKLKNLQTKSKTIIKLVSLNTVEIKKLNIIMNNLIFKTSMEAM